jgi:hypothetical protein
MDSPAYKVGRVVIAAIIVFILVVGMAIAAFAHNKSASLTCTTANVSLTFYDSGARVTVVYNGVTIKTGTFGASGQYVFSDTFTSRDSTLVVDVDSDDGNGTQYDFHYSESTTGCSPTPTSPGFSYTTYYCDSTDWTVKGSNDLELSPFNGGAYKIELAGNAPLIVDSFSGLPPYGNGTYTITAFDKDANDGWAAGSATYTPTFLSETSIVCQPPDIVVPTQSATDHSCQYLGVFTPTATAGVDWFISIDGGPKLPWTGGVPVYGTSDGTDTGTPLDGQSIELFAEKSGKADLSGQTYWKFPFNVPDNCEVTASLVYELGECVAPGMHSGNSGDLTGSAGVTFTDSINGAAPVAISAGHYNNADITPGTHDVVATAPPGVFYHFPGGGTTLVFPQVTFPDTSKLNCDETVTPDPWSVTDACGLPDEATLNIVIHADTAILDYEYVVDTVANTVKFTVDVIAYGYNLPNGTTHDEETISYTDELCVVAAPPPPTGFCNAGYGYYSVPPSTLEHIFTDDHKGHVSVAPTAGNTFPPGTQTSWDFEDKPCTVIQFLAYTGVDVVFLIMLILALVFSGWVLIKYGRRRMKSTAPPAQGV